MLIEGDIIPVKLALLSSYTKTDLVDFAKFLNKSGARLLSTGGTAQLLQEAQIPVLEVSFFTNFPEMLDGRLKTLHPLVHGGLLGRPSLPSDQADMEAHGIKKIDLLYVTLYPFEDVLKKNSPVDMCIENIDIGGPAMIRSAAKNYQYTTVLVDPEDMLLVEEDYKKYEGISLALRRKLAFKAFSRTAYYDALIAQWFAQQESVLYPKWYTQPSLLKQKLRYGENEHQIGAIYQAPIDADQNGVLSAKQEQGKNLSYNNLNDADAALELICEFDPKEMAACAIIKHANPCGVSLGEDTLEAYERALACDPVSAFGGVVVLNRPLDEKTALKILDIFTEIVIAPGAQPRAIELFKKKPNIRLLLVEELLNPRRHKILIKSISGGFLLQSRDDVAIKAENLRAVTTRQPLSSELEDMVFALKVVKHVRSNAILYAKDRQTLGIGAGQMSRIDATQIATNKARSASRLRGGAKPLLGCVMASDAFFPFPDSVLEAAAQGCEVIIQPGGSIRDHEVIEAANNEGLCMVFTGTRHFRH